MKLIDLTLAGFADELASASPAPGGGSTAALEGALGAALLHMVGAFTSGKAKYAECQPFLDELLEQSHRLQKAFIDVIDRDTEAFNSVTAVFAMPKETEADKAARQEAMQNALKACTKTPFEMMELARATAVLAHKAVGKTNPNTASDFGVGALSLKASAQGAWLNILINISGIKDKAFVEKYKGEGGRMLAQVSMLCDEIYEGVVKSLA